MRASARHQPLGPDFARLLVAGGVSNVGDGVRLTALPLLAATLTRDPAPVAGVSFAGGLPWLLFALVGGAVADRNDRRRIMWVANAVRCVVAAGLAAAVAADVTTVPLLYAVAFVLGVAEVFFDNASQSILPAIVERDALERANGRLGAVELVANTFVGPPLGGFLFAAAAAAPFLVDSLSFAVSAALVASLVGYVRLPAAGPRGRLRTDVAEGMRWLWRHRLLRTLALELGLLNLTSSAAWAVLVLLAQDVYGLGDVGFGVLSSAGALGGVIGGVVASRTSRALGAGTTLVVCVVLMGAPMVVVGITSDPFVAGAMIAVMTIFIVVWNVVTVSLRQSVVPSDVLGRVNSAYRLLGWGSMPLGAALGGWLAEAFGLRAPFVVGGLVALVSAAAILPVVNNRTMEAARQAAP